MMARIQPTDDKSVVEPTYDAELMSEKLKTVMHTSADDQIDSNIIFDNPYVDNNSGQAEHDSNVHDQPYANIESLIFNVQCYPTNYHDDLRKMKPKADIGIFIGYSESSRGFRIYNHRTRKIMEIIYVKFDELTEMASECNNSGPGLNYSNYKESSEDSTKIPSKEDLDNLFGHLYEEYCNNLHFQAILRQ
ncbi:hypothetical protein Tco_1169486 [Tanacetum coccineum]